MRQAGAEGAAVSVWGLTREPSPTVTRRLARTLAAIGLRPQVRLWERGALLAALADPGAPSQIGYARWRNDFPDGADWFPLLLSGSAIRAGGNLNYSLLDDDRVNRLIARAGHLGPGCGPSAGGRSSGRRGAAPGPLRQRRPHRRAVGAGAGYVPHQLYGFLWMRARLG